MRSYWCKRYSAHGTSSRPKRKRNWCYIIDQQKVEYQKRNGSASDGASRVLTGKNRGAPRKNQISVTEEKEEVEDESEKLDVPSEAELPTLRHCYAFVALKFVLGVRMRALTNYSTCICSIIQRLQTITKATRSLADITWSFIYVDLRCRNNSLLLAVWLFVEYEIWPLIVTAMGEVPVFGWSLLAFSLSSALLYVREHAMALVPPSHAVAGPSLSVA